MKLTEDKLRSIVREEIQNITEAGDYSETGFHGGSEKTSWDHIGGRGGFDVRGKSINSITTGQQGKGHVAMHFQDGTKLEFFADDTVFYTR